MFPSFNQCSDSFPQVPRHESDSRNVAVNRDRSAHGDNDILDFYRNLIKFFAKNISWKNAYMDSLIIQVEEKSNKIAQNLT